MIKHLLKVRAHLENCTDLQPLDNEDYPHDYGFIIQCRKCKTVHPKTIVASRFDTEKAFFDRTVNFAKRCKECNNEILLILIRTEKTITPENDEYVPILEIHSHGCIVREYVIEDQYMCKSMSNKPFAEIDLRVNEWTEFDVATNQPMVITNFEYAIEEIRGNSAVSSL